MWETTNLNLFFDLPKMRVERFGIPHLAKNERDMGHPTILGREKDVPEESVLYGAVENLKIVTLW
jgi:hypothetical protein